MRFLRGRSAGARRESRAITSFEVEPSLKSKLAAIIKIPDAGDDELNPLTAVIPWQIISYKAAISRGYNPDKPRNLAKSVTVE